jgi:LasA protease
MTRQSILRCAAVGSAGLLAAALPGSPATADTDDLIDKAVTEQVTGELLDRAKQSPQTTGSTPPAATVTVTRRSGANWAFGTGVLRAPATAGAYPRGWLFLAERQGGVWQVSLEGEPEFAALARRAPMLGDAEADTLAATGGVSLMYANRDYRTGMRLPYALGASWKLSGGPHGSPRNAVDLAGGDQVVRAARGGTAYTMCKGWVRVVHDRGYATDYYHLWSNIRVNGTWVSDGAFLGYTGTDVTCGGAAYGRHVHFGLRQYGEPVPIARHIIGKWTPYNGSAEYAGYALHGSRRVNVGGTLYNYGRLGFTQGIVDSYGSTSLNRRSGPGTGYRVVGTVADGATVSVACSRNGTSHTGRFGTTSLWNKLTDGTWISDAYLENGVTGPVNGWC